MLTTLLGTRQMKQSNCSWWHVLKFSYKITFLYQAARFIL